VALRLAACGATRNSGLGDWWLYIALAFTVYEKQGAARGAPFKRANISCFDLYDCAAARELPICLGASYSYEG
jgi:hypothetical protein